MEILILARHGDYKQVYESLTVEGQKEIESLATELSKFVKGRKTTILSSPARRAIQSAKLLQKRLKNALFEKHRCLDPIGESPQNIWALDAIDELIKANEDSEIVIIMTHNDHLEDYPPHFFARKFNIRPKLPYIKKGGALIIDCLTGAFLKY